MDNNIQELPKTVEPRNWNLIESAVKQGKAVVRDYWGDMTVDIIDNDGEYRAIDVFGEEWLVESARPEIHEFSVEWFSLPSPLPNPEDYAENDGDRKLVELFARVEMRYEYVARMNLRLENPSLTEEETLEKWLDSAQDDLPLWFMPENGKLSFYMRRKSDPMLAKYGEQGLANLRAHAELLNMSLEQLEAISVVAPVALLEMLQEAMLKKQRENPSNWIYGGRYA